MSSNEYEIREAREDEKANLDWLLLEHFYPNEFLQKAFVDTYANLNNSESLGLFRKYLLARHMKFMAENPCLLAIHRASDQVVALCILTIHDNPKFAQKKAAHSIEQSISNDVVKSCLKRFIDLCTKYNAFQVHPEIRNSLDLKALVVMDEHRRRGLAEALTKAAIDMARARNIGMIESLFTSPYTIRIANKLGFIAYADDDLATIKDIHGHFIFPGLHSHLISAMAMKL